MKVKQTKYQIPPLWSETVTCRICVMLVHCAGCNNKTLNMYDMCMWFFFFILSCLTQYMFPDLISLLSALFFFAALSNSVSRLSLLCDFFLHANTCWPPPFITSQHWRGHLSGQILIDDQMHSLLCLLVLSLMQRRQKDGRWWKMWLF